MAHMQQQVLEAVQAVLVAANTRAGTRVYLDRIDPVPPSSTPAIVVDEAEQGETIEPATIGGLQNRTLVVRLRLVESANASPADVRAFGLEAEKALEGAAGIAALVSLCKLGWMILNSRHVPADEGDRSYAMRLQIWRFSYLVQGATPDQAA